MSPRPQKIWITRAQPGADATAVRVRALRHEPVIAPLLTVRRLEDVRVDLSGVMALAFTSANAVWCFAELCDDRSSRVFAVGSATAEAARRAGFKRVLSADGDVSALVEGIAVRRAEIGGVVLHPGAVDLAGDLAGELAKRKVEVRSLPLYDTVPTVLTADELAGVAGADVVLLHSPKAAEVLAGVLKAQPMPHLRILALSKAVLQPVARAKVSAKAFAPFPLEAAMLNLIDR
jgi:uroporphyrinogen-III synthase